MKLRRIAALLLATALLPVPAALASMALGTEVHESVQILGPGAALHTGRLWSATYSDLRTERYLTYTPSPGVEPVVAYGTSVSAKNTVAELARGLEGYGGRVLGGVNGDYFVVASGVPLGLVVTWGVLRTGSSYQNGIGFLRDGSAFIGTPSLRIGLTANGSRIAIGEMNKTRTIERGVCLFTPDFGPNTQNSQPGIDVILTPVAQQPSGEDGLPYDAQPRIGGRILCTVDAVLHSEREIAIPAGSFVLSVNGQCQAALLASVEALVPGETVTIDITASDPRWSEAVTAIGAFSRLLTNGVVAQGLDQAQHPRTAVGVKPDGSAIFYTIDGRQAGHSVGASMTQVAERLLELGCTDAVLLDGGGSTSLGTTGALESGFSLKNRSSDGAAGRRASNALFLVSHQKPTSELGSIVLEPGDAMLLAGAQIDLKTFAIDTAHHPMYPFTGASFETDGGTADETGRLTTPDAHGVVTVTARYGEAEGSGTYTVVQTPDVIRLSAAGEDSVAAVNLDPGGSIDLNATASYRNLPLITQDDCFTWAVSPEVGTVNQNGVFTAGSKGASGNLTVTAGARTVSIPVSVAGHVVKLEDFEGSTSAVVGMDTCAAVLETDPAYVRFGAQSMRLDYNAAADGLATVFAPYPIAEGEEYLSTWVYGDGSGGSMGAMFLDAQGGVMDAALTVLDFEGWRQIVCPIPAGAVSLNRLSVRQGQGDDGLGSVWIDQITTANQYVIDVEAPTVTAQISNSVLTARVTDAVDRYLSKGQISFQYDGWLLDFTFDSATGKLSANLPAADGALHRVTVTATDRSGNISRASVDIQPAPPAAGDVPPFVDIAGHWAEPYARYLHRVGVALGSPSAGGTVFLPDDNIKRSEFFVLAARSMRIDLAQYSAVTLPFTDAARIPDWALPGIRAMYALGFVRGSQEGSGLYVFADQTITRAEAMTILGRMQDKGYAMAELNFLDAAEVPPWSADYVRTLFAQGVVSGYMGQLRPGAPITRAEVAKLLYTMR